MSKIANTNKKTLTHNICTLNPTISPSQIEKVVTTIFDEIATALVCGDRVEIRGFGSFVVKKRSKGIVRNPKSGEVINTLTDRGSLYFRASKEFTKILNFSSANDNEVSSAN